MSDLDATSLAERWVNKWAGKAARSSDSGDLLDLDLDVRVLSPACSLLAISIAAERIREERLIALLAAGPLEDLLNYYGDDVIEQVDKLCRTSRAFRGLIPHVWISGASAVVRDRLRKYGSVAA